MGVTYTNLCLEITQSVLATQHPKSSLLILKLVRGLQKKFGSKPDMIGAGSYLPISEGLGEILGAKLWSLMLRLHS